MAETNKTTEVDLDQVQKVIKAHLGHRWPLIPLLQTIQAEFGFISPGAIPLIAKELNLFASQVQGVVSFYEQLYTEPRGKNIVRVCRGTACHVRGGKIVLKLVKQQLGLEENQTSEDLEYTLETVACLGVCALSPSMVVNQQVCGHMNPKKVRQLFKTEGG